MKEYERINRQTKRVRIRSVVYANESKIILDSSHEATKYLLIANAYPREDALYRNGFIHRRVKAYQQNGIEVEVFYLHPPVTTPYEYTFDGVDVTVGNRDDLAGHLERNSYTKFLIHFASPDMILPILDASPETPIVVWIHGFEAEAWYRRWFNFIDSAASIRHAIAKKNTYYDGQLEFMKWLYQTKDLKLTFIHVSEWFQKHIVEPDAGARTQNSHIIPNLIDDKLFNYIKKHPNQRLKILSIRPYASQKYANDLMVKAIQALEKRPFFSALEFNIYGDGTLFDSTLVPLRNLPNVNISKGFLDQKDIAALHKENGVFLAPTRFDSQGVSMCEAMSSGLVPVTTDVAAIPEFVDHRRTGLLAPPEDHLALANWIERLYFNSELFESLSENTSQSIRELCAEDVSIRKELDIIVDGGIH